MSTRTRNRIAKRVRANAPVFAALGDDTRLSLLISLGDGRSHSITQLACGAEVSRQAITKHLHILEEAGLIRGARHGRENRFQLQPQSLAKAKQALDAISAQWGQALLRLKSFVEESHVD